MNEMRKFMEVLRGIEEEDVSDSQEPSMDQVAKELESSLMLQDKALKFINDEIDELEEMDGEPYDNTYLISTLNDIKEQIKSNAINSEEDLTSIELAVYEASRDDPYSPEFSYGDTDYAMHISLTLGNILGIHDIEY